jgi:large subunit ribosomal protein L35
MPKLKTVKGVKDRFKVTGTGKVIANRPGRRHLLAHKRRKTMRHLRRGMTLPAAEARLIIALLP